MVTAPSQISQILLIGMPGSGKSTVGKQLAKLVGRAFCDLDEILVAGAGKSIQAIFTQQGEKVFRDLEAAVLATSLKGRPSIIATGGGVILREDNRLLMKEGHVVIYLAASLDTLMSRLQDDGERPLLVGQDRRELVRQLLNQREELYQQLADITLSIDGLTTEMAATQLQDLIKARPDANDLLDDLSNDPPIVG